MSVGLSDWLREAHLQNMDAPIEFVILIQKPNFNLVVRNVTRTKQHTVRNTTDTPDWRKFVLQQKDKHATHWFRLTPRDFDFPVAPTYPVMESSESNCSFVKGGPLAEGLHKDGHSHSHSHGHEHGHEHGHTHDVMDNPGSYLDRDKPLYRQDWKQRAYTVGIGGPVGSGKTALVLSLCKHLRESVGLCVVTNDIFTREDWEFLVRNKALPTERMRAVETGGCPHAAIREDYSLNMEEIRSLTKEFDPQIVIIESGGDNLAANYSRELADYIIYVIDVAGGDKVPRKGGPGITQSDLLVVNKTDLAEAVGADLKVMDRDAKLMRQDGPTIFAQAKHMVGIPEIAQLILTAYRSAVPGS